MMKRRHNAVARQTLTQLGTVAEERTQDEETQMWLKEVVSWLGLEPRAVALRSNLWVLGKLAIAMVFSILIAI